jgi:adenylate kinase family enzyme
MLFFGKPGAGKGTLSARMTKKYDVTQLSAGDLLRTHIAEGYAALCTSGRQHSTMLMRCCCGIGRK